MLVLECSVVFTISQGRNYEKGKQILEQGLSITGVDDSKYILDRLKDIKEETAEFRLNIATT